MFEFRNKAGRDELYIYGTIGEDFWNPEDENRAKDLADKLNELSPRPLDIHINSGGGDVHEGMAIASAIKNYEGDTCVYVDGLAASAASYIALMADKVVMEDFAFLMIHNAWTLTVGNRDELRDTADQLEKVDNTIALIIEARSGLSMDEVKAAMIAETWYTAAEAMDAGMCDEVLETEQKIAACIDARLVKSLKNLPGEIVVTNELPEPPLEEEEIVEDSETPDETDTDVDETNEKEVISHSVNSLSDEAGASAVKACVLGNRVYRL